MPVVSSRTPDGHFANCPICGAWVTVQPADPLDDAPCPKCGTLLWPMTHGRGSDFLRAEEISPEQRRKLIEIIAPCSDDMDSLDQAELLMDVEDLFEVSIPDDEAERMRSPRDVIEWLVGRRG